MRLPQSRGKTLLWQKYRRCRSILRSSREGLDRSLEAPDAKRENAEIDQCVQRQRVDTDAEISDDTGQDQRNSVKLLGKLSEYERSAKSNNLRSQKENDLSDGGKPQIRADVDAVVDNGAYAVDIASPLQRS